MANTLGTTNANVIAQRALEILVADYSFLRNAVTDFSAEAAKFNASVFTARISCHDRAGLFTVHWLCRDC
jgi:hypothetical protein